MSHVLKRTGFALVVSILSLSHITGAYADTRDGVSLTAPHDHEARAAVSEELALKHKRMANAFKAAQAGTRPPGRRSDIRHCEKLAKAHLADAKHHRELTASSF